MFERFAIFVTFFINEIDSQSAGDTIEYLLV